MSKRFHICIFNDIIQLRSIKKMKTTNNEIKIIQILLASNDYISTYEIATLIGISRRSVREEINNVKNILKEL